MNASIARRKRIEIMNDGVSWVLAILVYFSLLFHLISECFQIFEKISIFYFSIKIKIKKCCMFKKSKE